VIMAKEPRPGKTKTRLCPPLTGQEAADLSEALLLDTIGMLTGLVWIDLAVAFSPPAARNYFEGITPGGTLLLPVEGADIGDCLGQALGFTLERGYTKVMAINADGPSLPDVYLHQAVTLLDDCDAVFGEGHDGGYYLVGMKQFHSTLFQGISWSTPRVLTQTLEQAVRAGLNTALLPAWYDVDSIQDLERLMKEAVTLPHTRLINTRRFLGTLDAAIFARD